MSITVHLFVCEGCLWSSRSPGRFTQATHFVPVCMHMYCVPCINFLMKQNMGNKPNGRWFKCEVATCGTVVQLNQVKKLAPNEKEAEYLSCIVNFETQAKSIQKGIRFYIENYERYEIYTHSYA